MSFFEVAALPAREGDCLVLSYGPDRASSSHIVIDGGRAGTVDGLMDYLESIGVSIIELLVVTHVDADHIEGILSFLTRAEGRIEIRDVWFNGYKHLRDDLQAFGPGQGERLTELLSSLPWNLVSEGKAVRTNDDGSPRDLGALAGGINVTVLSPDQKKLAALVKGWEAACRDAGLIPGQDPVTRPAPPGLQVFGGDLDALAATRTGVDTAKANGTSIALLVEYGGCRVVLGADAHPDILTASLKATGEGQPVKVNLLKVPHHGSQANVTRELLATLDCSAFLLCTDGSKFRHPDEIAIARLITSRPGDAKLFFNYRQERTSLWEARVDGQTRFSCFFPEEGKPLVIDVVALAAEQVA